MDIVVVFFIGVIIILSVALIHARMRIAEAASSTGMLTQSKFYKLLRKKRPQLLTLRVMSWPENATKSAPIIKRVELRFEADDGTVYRTQLDRSELPMYRAARRRRANDDPSAPLLCVLLNRARWNKRRDAGTLADPVAYISGQPA